MTSTQGMAGDGAMSHISVLSTHAPAPLTLAVPPGARVADLKTAIAERCPGQPKPNGQRIIWKGRIVVDEEVVGDIWKPGEDTHTVHLAVHPSAWSSPPAAESVTTTNKPTPTTPLAFPAHSIGAPLPSPLLSTFAQPTPLPTQYTIAKDYVMYHHTNALRVMAGQPLEPWSYPWLDQASAAHWAYLGLTSAGHTFPSVLMSLYPPYSPNERGVEYTVVHIDNRPYLSLVKNGASPTPMQNHAIQVLTSTLGLIPYLDELSPQAFLRLPGLQINPQQLQLPARTHARVTAQRLRRLAIALRTLIPLSFTLLRASLFIVFFPQAREPLWLTVIIGVVLYEARLIITRANNAVPNVPADPNDPNPTPVGPAPNPNANTGVLSMNFQTLLDRATLSGVDSEANLLDLEVPERDLRPAPNDPSETNPVLGVAARVKSFILLLGVTLVPAAWARRREALRLREGRVRVVYGERANAVRVEGEDGEEVVGMLGEKRIQALREGGWRRQYVERVLDGIEEHVE